MFRVQEWAEVHRLFHREKCSKVEIEGRLGMSRTTVYRLLALREPATYERGRRPSLLDPHKARIAELLFDDAEAPATVIIDHLRREGYGGGITIRKDHPSRECTSAPQSFGDAESPRMVAFPRLAETADFSSATSLGSCCAPYTSSEEANQQFKRG